MVGLDDDPPASYWDEGNFSGAILVSFREGTPGFLQTPFVATKLLDRHTTRAAGSPWGFLENVDHRKKTTKKKTTTSIVAKL